MRWFLALTRQLKCNQVNQCDRTTGACGSHGPDQLPHETLKMQSDTRHFHCGCDRHGKEEQDRTLLPAESNEDSAENVLRRHRFIYFINFSTVITASVFFIPSHVTNTMDPGCKQYVFHSLLLKPVQFISSQSRSHYCSV